MSKNFKNFLYQKKLISEKWNALNILIQNASTVGALDLKIQSKDKNNFEFFDNIKNNKFKLIYLLNSDNLKFEKNDEFIIYQGSHGDKGAEIADIILPGAAYTEQSGHYTNLEGKIQKAYKASYPPGEAKEDWQIINDLAELMNNRKLFNDKDELQSSMFNFLNLKKEKQKSGVVKEINQEHFESEDLKIKLKDYYFSNVIARSSKTMLDCHNSKLDIKRTGTEG